MIALNENGTYLTTLTEKENHNIYILFVTLNEYEFETNIDTYASLINAYETEKDAILDIINNINTNEEVKQTSIDSLADYYFAIPVELEDDYVNDREYLLKEIANLIK